MPGLRRRPSAERAAQRRVEQARLDAEHRETTAAIFRTARSAAESLSARGSPGISGLTDEIRRGWLNETRPVDLRGWRVYHLRDGPPWARTNVYLLSDGHIRIRGGEPIDSMDRLLTPKHAKGLLEALRRL